MDLGESSLRLDLPGIVVGASTATQVWGPAVLDPLIVGNNAAGIPHLFLGTSRPLNVGIGTVHVRLEAGRLDQSAYSYMEGDSTRRQMAGLVAVATIRGVPGLEIGGTRFYHRLWGDGISWETFKIPFESVYKNDVGEASKDSIAENQLASLYARWVLPSAGLEVYGEAARNDHSFNSRDLLLEPDHNFAYTLGARHVRRRGRDGLLGLRLETMNARASHLDRIRGQARLYQHAQLRQGHTQRGQLLGSAAGLGGLATTLGADLYRPDGRWTMELARRARAARQGFGDLGEGAWYKEWDVEYIARAERVRFGRTGDLVLGVAAVANLNQNFVHDRYGLRVDFGWRPALLLGGARTPVPAATAAPAP